MSYKTYTTEAIVCGSRANNTSDKSFLLLAREAGMLWASAKSVREERSKQRFALQDFSLVRVSLIKGKNGWKVGSVENEINYFLPSKRKADRQRVTAIVKLLRQFVHGEVSQPAVFDDAKAALGLALQGELSEAALTVFTLRFLNHLGYIASPLRFTDHLEAAKWWTLPPAPPEAETAIRRAKAASHL